MQIAVDQVQMIRDIKTVGEPIIADYVAEQRKSTIFMIEDKFYGTGSGTADKFEIDRQRNFSASLGLPSVSSSFRFADYMDDPNTMRDRIRRFGSRISGPGVNQLSPQDGIGFAPIIEVFEVNPNLIQYAADSQISKFASPTNIIIRGASAPVIEDTPIAPLNA